MRTSIADLEKKRAGKSSRILLTGGTGFLGSHIAVKLIQAGYRVYLLARGDRGLSAGERVARLLDWHGVGAKPRQNLRVVEGTIERPDLGLEAGRREVLLGNIDEIIHAASNTSFAERKRPAVEAANIGGLRNMLDFAVQSRCFFFHYLSTAYAAGRKIGLCREDLVESGEFTNPYEETKARGEKIAFDRCRSEGIRLNIYRPTIVYGDSWTGRSLRFNAVYYPVKTAVFLKNLYEADIRERGGKKAGLLGIRMEDDGRLHMPLRLELGPEGGINLIPVNYFTEAFIALMEECPGGGIFHIANSRPKRIEDIIEYAKTLFRLQGVESCRAEDFLVRPKNALEILFASYLEAYAPYMRDPRLFDLTKSGAVLERKHFVCPEFNYEIFAKCMNYAVEVDWGAKLFPKPN